MPEKDKPPFKPKRVTRTYSQAIKAPPETVFPLLCPVREAQWLDGWEYDMLFSRSGLVEEGCVFTTPGAGEPDTVWVVTRHDPGAREVDFTRLTPGSRTCVLKIVVTQDGKNASAVGISYTYTAITVEGNDWIETFTEEVFLKAVRFWERSMNHFLQTGERLQKV